MDVVEEVVEEVSEAEAVVVVLEAEGEEVDLTEALIKDLLSRLSLLVT